MSIGPWRVAPVAWLFRDGNDGDEAFAWLESHQDRYSFSTRGIEFVATTGGTVPDSLSELEQRLLNEIANGPRSLDELTERLHTGYWPLVPLDALERRHLVVKSSLTPTDVVHAAGRLELWNADAATRLCRFFCRLLGVSLDVFTGMVHQQIVRRLATELLRKQLAERAETDKWDRTSAAAAMVDNWLNGGTDDYRVHVALRYPIIGIGAPIHLYLPDAAQLLETQAVIPLHADVANAIGAITARVLIHRQVEIEPTETGHYRVSGLPNAPTFAGFEEAHRHAVDQLLPLVRRQAKEAGTSSTRVEVLVHDRVAPSGYGGQIFIGRILTARLSGRPDVARLMETESGQLMT